MADGGSNSNGQGGSYGGGGLQGGYGSGGGVNAGGGANSGGQGTFGGSRGGGYENSAGYGDQTAAQNAADAKSLAAASYQTFGQAMFGGLWGDVADKMMGSVPVVGQIMGLSNMLGQSGYKTGNAPAQNMQGIGGGYGNGGGGWQELINQMVLENQNIQVPQYSPQMGGTAFAPSPNYQSQASQFVLPDNQQVTARPTSVISKSPFNLF
jgi:hypothetical protein